MRFSRSSRLRLRWAWGCLPTLPVRPSREKFGIWLWWAHALSCWPSPADLQPISTRWTGRHLIRHAATMCGTGGLKQNKEKKKTVPGLVFQKCSPSSPNSIVGERSDSYYPSQKPLSVPSAPPGSSGHPCHRGLSACVPGDLISRLTSDTTMVSDLVSQNINIFLRNTVKVTGVVVFMFSLSWQLSLVTFMGFPIIMMVSNIYGKYYKRLSKEVQSALARASTTAEETISAMKTVRSFANEEEEAEVFLRKLQQVYKLNRKEAAAYMSYVWGSGLTLLVVQVSILYYGGHLVISGQMSSGNLIAFIIYEFVLGDCMESVGSVYSGLMQGVGAAEKVFEFIDRQPTMVHDGSLAPDHLEGRVDFENVTFTYRTRPHTQVLQNVSFSLSPGKVTALVGPSGSGKSSCVNILENFYPLQGGRVLLDGKPIGAYDHKYLHRVISLVSQEPVLFARSITDNISYGLPTVPFEMVVEAAQKANAHGFIMELQDGYSTETGEKGAQLSGGQKQRVAMARALVRNPPVLILDEATSALDAESEYLIQQAIHGNLQRHTVLIIAHRLSTVERAHLIVVLDKGRVVQQGTHQQLLAQGGLYAKLVQRQMLGLEHPLDYTAGHKEPPGNTEHKA
ncbi:ATP-binding cassette sub-family B member 9 isoform X2 [Mus pahari]|uniref:ATP-binding cassette sub-family B member 9 isoform X2 n=1 Tax=Mus pahari TaxID=10093 RepID=UPI0011149E7C|nr:ATP-binding cassette sub-family B member 9 isoform X2 [Mus pahari]